MDLSLLFKNEGFLDFSHVSLKSPISIGVYDTQIWNKNFGNMDFLEAHAGKKKNLQYKSALVALYPYYPSKNTLKSNLKVALYAREEDYHFVLKNKLNHIIDQLKEKYPEEEFHPCIDSSPVLERDLAYLSGLGWVGKNTCLLNKKHGSLFFISEVLTSLQVTKQPQLQTDHCGTCTKCIDACPTQALSPRKLNVEKCISYQNIENRSLDPSFLKTPLHSWFFGCDICQTVCPWNIKVHGKENMAVENEVFKITPEVIEELKLILSQSNTALLKNYKYFSLTRARAKGLKRNALKVIYDHNINELKPFLRSIQGQYSELDPLIDFVIVAL